MRESFTQAGPSRRTSTTTCVLLMSRHPGALYLLSQLTRRAVNRSYRVATATGPSKSPSVLTSLLSGGIATFPPHHVISLVQLLQLRTDTACYHVFPSSASDTETMAWLGGVVVAHRCRFPVIRKERKTTSCSTQSWLVGPSAISLVEVVTDEACMP